MASVSQLLIFRRLPGVLSVLLRPCFQRVAPQGQSCIRLLESKQCLHTSVVRKVRKVSSSSKVLSGINDCPHNCLCSNNIEADYKNPRLLSQFVCSQTGVIYPRTITKVCMTKQREISKAIKRSRTMGFMPYTHKLPEYLDDPKLF